ncbi:MAG TPA: hypothetical protein VEF34_14815 [Syntrophobacteraceae bacterium]|nr:hypothetical protein [Syntrophobacteraceae bacterium]
MRKERIEYGSPLDALVALAKRLSLYEDHYRLESEEFYDRFSKGRLEDSADFVEWANDYEHYLSIRSKIEKSMQQHVA